MTTIEPPSKAGEKTGPHFHAAVIGLLAASGTQLMASKESKGFMKPFIVATSAAYIGPTALNAMPASKLMKQSRISLIVMEGALAFSISKGMGAPTELAMKIGGLTAASAYVATSVITALPKAFTNLDKYIE